MNLQTQAPHTDRFGEKLNQFFTDDSNELENKIVSHSIACGNDFDSPSITNFGCNTEGIKTFEKQVGNTLTTHEIGSQA